MNTITISEQINAIQNVASLGELPAKYWPNTHSEEYLFISYSHRDYKAVFKDIILLQNEGINVWYDKSIGIGNDWETEAEQYISNYNCIGVVFYLSNNSLSSESIKTEIEYVKKRNKPYFSINLPISVDGKEVTLSAKDIYASLPTTMKNKETECLIDKVFNDKVIYLSINDDTSIKVQRIREKLKLAPLYNFAESVFRPQSSDPAFRFDYLPIGQYNYSVSTDGFATLLSVNNMDIINPPDIPDVVTLGETHYFLTKIDNCAFANCRKLERITLPQSLQLIKPNAFYGCHSLTKLLIPNSVMRIGSSAFSGCCSLIELDLPDTVYEIRDWVFAGCTELQEIFIPASVVKIGPNCFANCPKLHIKCEAVEKPVGWADNFNPDNQPLLWGQARR